MKGGEGVGACDVREARGLDEGRTESFRRISRPFLRAMIFLETTNTFEVKRVESIGVSLTIRWQVFFRTRLHAHTSGLADSYHNDSA